MIKLIGNDFKPDNINKKAFTLIELLVVIAIIGFIVVAAMVIFNIVRMNARDAVRVGNITTIKKALAIYLGDSATGYPFSSGECLSASGVGGELQSSNALAVIPTDPLWPGPNVPYIPNPDVANDADGFCYWYVSDQGSYQLSYFLESNSKSGSQGTHTTTQ